MRSLKKFTLNEVGESNKFAVPLDDVQRRLIANPQPTGVCTNVYSTVEETGVESLYNMQTTTSSVIFSKPKSNPPVKKRGPVPTVTGTFFCNHQKCLVSCYSRNELRKHKLSHRVKKHKCQVEGCDSAFFEKSKLTRHQTVHSKEKLYPCPLCPKRFGYKQNVKAHLLTHSGKTPFACSFPGCKRTFAQASNCKVHERTHSNNKRKSAGRKRKRSTSSQTVKAARVTDVLQRSSNRNVDRVQQREVNSISGMLTPLSFNMDQLDGISITETMLGDDLFSPEGANLFPKVNGETWFGEDSQETPTAPNTLKKSLECPDSFYAEKDNIDLHKTSIDSVEFDMFCQE